MLISGLETRSSSESLHTEANNLKSDCVCRELCIGL